MPRRKSASNNSSRKIPAHLVHSAGAKQRAELKQHGFPTTKKGVAVDAPRDKTRARIPGAKFEIQSGGWVKWSVGQRRDFIYGMTDADRADFAFNPEAFIAQKQDELIESHPATFRKIRRAPQVRLQWGAYTATKDWSISEWMRAYPKWDKARAPKRTSAARDRLVGIRFIVHIPKKRKRK